jgi:hypothetical protein
MPDLRRGWPLDYIPAGRENWIAFVRQATDDQLDQVCLSVARDALRAGQYALALEAVETVLASRARRGVGGVLQ